MFYIGLITLLWLLYSYIEGYREGYYWHFKSTSTDNNNFEIHPIFSAQRGIVIFIIVLFHLFLQLNLFLDGSHLLAFTKSFIFGSSLALMFSFIHNGTYYKTRNKIDPKVYPKKWWAQSTTSTSLLTKFMSPVSRTIQFIVGLTSSILVCIL